MAMRNNKNISCSNNDNDFTLSCNKNNYMNNIRTNSNSHNNYNSNNQHFHFHFQPQHTVGDISDLVNKFKSDDYERDDNGEFVIEDTALPPTNNKHITNHYNINNFHFHFEPVGDINELVNKFKSDDYESGGNDDENDGFIHAVSSIDDLGAVPLDLSPQNLESCRRFFVSMANKLTERRTMIDAMMDTQCPLCDELMQKKESFQVYDINLECFYCDGCDKKIETFSDGIIYHCCECNGGYDLCEKCVIEVCDLANFPACRKILTQNKYKTIHALKQKIMQRTSDNEKIYEISIDPPLNITGQRGRFWIKASSLVTTKKSNKYKYKCLINNAFLAADTAKMQIQHMIYRELRLDPLMQQQ